MTAFISASTVCYVVQIISSPFVHCQPFGRDFRIDYKLTFFGYSGSEFDFRDPYDVTARDHSWNTSINIPFQSPAAMRDHLVERVRTAGADTDFGYPGAQMHRIDTPPYYTTREMAMALTTCGGLQIDEYSRVLNTRSQPIGGLYAIGNVSGSMLNGTYPHSMNCLSHTRCVVFGYLTGKTLTEAPRMDDR